MSIQILTVLKNKLNDLAANGELNAETRRNTLKEELQFYLLNFIYHHKEYNQWIMYGGSALRIIHGLNRMSVDLDFEVAHTVTANFLEELKKEIENYLINAYGANDDFVTMKIINSRGLRLKFHVGQELSLGYSSNQVWIEIHLHHFVALKTVIERRPINRNQFSLVILTYNMSALMASKLAAILLRGTRAVGKDIYHEKGRDIYDLLWYMEKKIVPDFDYLIAKGVDIKDLRALFDKLTVQMNKVNDKNLKDDLAPLFVDKTFIANWLSNWHESYFKLLEEYKMYTATELKQVEICYGPSDIFSFFVRYQTEENKLVRIHYLLANDSRIDFDEGDLRIKIDPKIGDKIVFDNTSWEIKSATQKKQEKLKQYAMLFYQKTENYLKKTNRIMVGDRIVTKIIRMDATNLNLNEQIALNRSNLLSCELDDLLK